MNVNVSDLKEGRIREWQVIDVRSASEFAAGHIPGSVNIPLEYLESRMADIDPAGNILLVCRSGQRARLAADRLATFSEKCAVLKGGTDAWAKQGLPVIASAASGWSLERQVRLGAGLMVLVGLTFGFAAGPVWFGLSAFAGAGLTFAGLTDLCPMASLLARMPWNRRSAQRCVKQFGCGI